MTRYRIIEQTAPRDLPDFDARWKAYMRDPARPNPLDDFTPLDPAAPAGAAIRPGERAAGLYDDAAEGATPIALHLERRYALTGRTARAIEAEGDDV